MPLTRLRYFLGNKVNVNIATVTGFSYNNLAAFYNSIPAGRASR